MSSPNDPNRPKPRFSIPDMTIPERTDPSAPQNLPYGQPDDSVKKLAPWDKAQLPSSGWTVGDRVLAPWEPSFLYVGTIQRFENNKALIQFDDGDAGRVVVAELRRAELRLGQTVLSRRKMGALFYQGEILKMRGDEVLVGFSTGGAETEWTRIAALRILNDEAEESDGAKPTKVASLQVFLDGLRAGDRVWAPWNGNALFVGAVDSIDGHDAQIDFDDGDRAWVQLNLLLPFEPTNGMRVYANWRRQGNYYPGAITRLDGERIHIRYDDGDDEWTTAAALALPLAQNG